MGMERRGMVESGRKNKGPTIMEGERRGKEIGGKKTKRKGRKRDLPDQCQTASYAPARGWTSHCTRERG